MSGDIAVANRLAVQGYIAEVPSIIYPFVFCRIIVLSRSRDGRRKYTCLKPSERSVISYQLFSFREMTPHLETHFLNNGLTECAAIYSLYYILLRLFYLYDFSMVL